MNISIYKVIGSLYLIGFSVFTSAQQSTQHTYNVYGQLESFDGPRTDVADVTQYEYNAKGNLILETNALGYSRQFHNYNLQGRPTQVVDENGVSTLVDYDFRGRITRATLKHPSGMVQKDQTTIYTYDAVGQLTRIDFPNATWVILEYDDARRLVAIQNALAERIEYTLDDDGNRTKSIILDESGILRYKVQNAFDELSRLTSSVGNNNQLTQFQYDQDNQRIATINGRGFVFEEKRDALGRVEQIIDPKTGNTTLSYDAQGRLSRVTDAREINTEYVYDAFDNLTEHHSADTGTSEYEFDEAGNVLEKVDARGVVTRYSYDALNRVTQIAFPANPTENTIFHYDDTSNENFGIGRLTGIEDSSGTIGFIYNHRGQVTQQQVSVEDNTYTTQYQYDDSGQLTEIRYPSGRSFKIDYDSLARPISLNTTQAESQQTLLFEVDYEPFGPLKSYQFGNGIQRTYNYNLDYQLTDIITTGPYLTSDYGYFYDANGNIVQINATSSNELSSSQFNYDELDRLLSSEGDLFGDFIYRYDAVGNRLKKTHEGEPTVENRYIYATTSNRLENTQTGSYQAADQCPECLTTNYALGKPATLSSVGFSTSADWAVDGNTSGSWNDNSIAHTNWENQPWFEVDLENQVSISRIVLHNRTDCCSERLQDFYVLVSPTPFTSNNLETELARTDVTYRYYKNAVASQVSIDLGAPGRYIRVQLAGENAGLGLAELQVFGNHKVYGANIALQGTASQISDYNNQGTLLTADIAIDGDTNGDFSNGGQTSHTQFHAQAWWQVDLGSVKTLGSITIFNRTDCCADRLQDFYIMASSTPFPSTSLAEQLANSEVQAFYVNTVDKTYTQLVDLEARYVRIQLNSADMGIALAEVVINETRPADIEVFQLQRELTTEYDAVGNTLDNGEFSFVYNLKNRLTSATNKTTGEATHYTYNSLGQRTSKKNTLETEYYHYDLGGKLIAVYNGNREVISEYLYLGNQVVGLVQNGQLYYAISDHLGTVKKLVNTGGNVVWQVESQTPFGIVETDEDVDGDGQAIEFNLRFPGQYFDRETGFSYNYFRDYDAGLGRYLQSDPIGLGGGINTYTYVLGNPLTYSDPLGLAAGDNPPRPPNSGNWVPGKWPNGKPTLTPPGGEPWTIHPEDKGHWPHWDKPDGSTWPENSKKPWPGQKKPKKGQSPTNPNDPNAPPYCPTDTNECDEKMVPVVEGAVVVGGTLAGGYIVWKVVKVCLCTWLLTPAGGVACAVTP